MRKRARNQREAGVRGDSVSEALWIIAAELAEIRGTIVVTLYKNRAYDVEFSGDINGTERDLAWRAIAKQYGLWKMELRKKEEWVLENKELKKEKEKEDARN